MNFKWIHAYIHACIPPSSLPPSLPTYPHTYIHTYIHSHIPLGPKFVVSLDIQQERSLLKVKELKLMMKKLEGWKLYLSSLVLSFLVFC